MTPSGFAGGGATPRLDPWALTQVSAVKEELQSYNVEMVEVTGGRFWKPYADAGGSRRRPGRPEDVGSSEDAGVVGTPAGMDPGLYEYRPPIDLANVRLRRLAGALAPAYIRVSGTWANTVYVPDVNERVDRPPVGFSSVLQRDRWADVVDFAASAGAGIVTSMSVGTGSRDAEGVWSPLQARRLRDLTAEVGGHLVGAELFNEPTVAEMGGAPQGYDAAAYGRDFRAFCEFVTTESGGWQVLGPGSVGETTGEHAALDYGAAGVFGTPDLLAASAVAGPSARLDRFTFHHYGAASQRCAEVGMPGTSLDQALSEEWLARPDDTVRFYRGLRDRFCPGVPMWCTETAQAACGGDWWASTYADAFRYVDQLGRFARGGVEVQFHNTLASSDYGLLDENTFAPRPTYWAALLWRRLMGTAVLDASRLSRPGAHAYAHDLRGVANGVAVAVVVTGQGRSFEVAAPGLRYTLSAEDLRSDTVALNRQRLEETHEQLPELEGSAFTAGRLDLDPETITFLTFAPGR